MLVFTFVFKLFKQVSHYLRDNNGISLNLQAVYFKHLFFKLNFQIICSRGKIAPLISLVAKLKEMKCPSVSHRNWRLNIAIKGIYFIFCIYGNRPWHFFCCRFFVLSGWTFACHFLGRVHRIFSLSRCRVRKRFFMPLQEFEVLALQKTTIILKTL